MIKGWALIADPNALFREGLSRLLRQERFQVCAEGHDVAAAIIKLQDGVDLSLVVCTLNAETCQQNMASLRELRGRFPQSKIVVITDMMRSLLREAIDVTDAILTCDISSRALQLCIDLVMLGQKFFSVHPLQMTYPSESSPPALKPLLVNRWTAPTPIVEKIDVGIARNQPLSTTSAASALHDCDPSLSDREREILKCLVHGHSNKVIARALDISEATVKVHLKGLLRKLRAANRTQAAVWALNHRAELNGVKVLAAE